MLNKIIRRIDKLAKIKINKKYDNSLRGINKIKNN